MPAAAQSVEPVAPADGLQIEETSDGITFAWVGQVQAGPSAPTIRDASGQWRTIEIGDRLLPAQLVSVVVEDSARIAEGKGNPKSLKQSFAPAALVVESAPWAANLPFVNIPIPQSSTGETYPDMARTPNPALPNAPVIVLREGYVRNLHLAVLAVTPIYEQDGVVRAATRINATVRGVRLLKDQNEILAQFDVNGAGREPLRSLAIPNASNAPEAPPVPGPTVWPNPNAVYKIGVAQTGVQVVSFSSLPAAPADLASANWNVRYNDQLLAIIMVDVNGNTKFDSSDYIKFYAPYAGDRLNTTTTYWLSYDNAPLAGARMATVSKPVTNAPVSSYALERRQWITRTLYTSLFAGEDGDHFFAGRTKASSPIPITVPPISFTLDGVLPPAGGNVSVTLAGIGTTSGAHNGEFTLNGVVKPVTWSGLGAIPASAGMFAIASPPQLSPPPLGTFQVKAQAGTAVDEVLIEAVKWERPVLLNNFGGKGAVFHTRTDGNFAYQLAGLPTSTFFLDITAPLTPTIMNKDGAATTYQFQDVPGRAYLMEGAGQTWTPTVSKHTPSAWANLNKNVLYVVPANLQASLAPLISLRTTQGYQPLAVNLEAIYDAWGYGQISAPAIRNFLRYAASAWGVPPIAVTFVGTSTFDPFNYLGDYGENQFVLPAYLGSVDPFIGETACDTCFAALDEDEAIFANKDDAIFPDLLFGRLPVKTAAELNTLVTKIVTHETAAFGSALNTWRSRIGLIADNYQFEDGHTDGAGNFAAFSEASARLHPSTIKPTRAYFDLCKPHTPTITLPPCDLQTGGLPGQTTIETMRQSIVNMFNAGQSLIVYNGHGNQVQIGDEKFIEAIDVVKLTNATMLPVVLQMTCYTSQFINNTYQTLDETLLLKANGGAIAIWGATGLGVAHGHDALQSGFLKAFWKPTNVGKTGKATVGSAPIGELTMMGYNELALNGGCCQDTIRTFLVLGDPLTSLRMQAPKGMYLPYTRKP